MTSHSQPASRIENVKTFDVWFYVSCMFSMALGWRIRGQFGHEVGACMAGALGAMSVALFSRREDWLQRIPQFAMLGAIGWGFGGSISYMKVVGYTHSSDSATVCYGFGGVLLIGFLWSALGAAAIALPAVLDNQRLKSIFTAVMAVCLAWFLWDTATDWIGKRPSQGYELGVRAPSLSGLEKYDLDWKEATAAIVGVLVLAAICRRIDFGSSLVLHLAIGWWAAVAILLLLLNWRLNPPRGDNWAGCVGLFTGLSLFCIRHRLSNVLYVAVLTGLIGGTGFCLGQALKLTFLSWNLLGDWHAVMESIHGLCFGFALAVGMRSLLSSRPEPPWQAMPRWTQFLGIIFVIGIIPYLNIRRSPSAWLAKLEKLPAEPFGIPLVAGLTPSRMWIGWFDSLWLICGLVLVLLMIRHLSRPIRIVAETFIGKGQLLYVLFAWIVTFMSFVHEVPKYDPYSLLIQWMITLNAILCTAIVLAGPKDPIEKGDVSVVRARWSRVLLVLSLFAAVASVFIGYQTKHFFYQGHFARGFYMDHIRFGPKNTDDIR